MRAVPTPDYAPGCKRRLVSDAWFPALQRSNVELVTTGLREITTDVVVAADGSPRRVDTIVMRRRRHHAWHRDLGVPEFLHDAGPEHRTRAQLDGVHDRGPDPLHRRRHQARARRGQRLSNCARRFRRAPTGKTQRSMTKTVWVSGGCRSWYQAADGRIDTLWPVRLSPTGGRRSDSSPATIGLRRRRRRAGRCRRLQAGPVDYGTRPTEQERRRSGTSWMRLDWKVSVRRCDLCSSALLAQARAPRRRSSARISVSRTSPPAICSANTSAVGQHWGRTPSGISTRVNWSPITSRAR